MSAWVEALEPGARCRKWRARAQVGSGDASRRRSKVVHGLRKDAMRAAQDMERELERQTATDTFEAFAHSWNGTRHAIGAISDNTAEQYRYLLNGMARHIGGMPLERIAARDVERAMEALKAGDTPSGTSWSGTTLRAALKASRRVFREAQARGLCHADPTASVTMPRSDTQPRKALGLEDAAALLGALGVEDAHEFACALMLSTGMRAGECLGALWSDVTAAGLHVRRESTKTDSGARLIPLDEATREMIARRRERVEGFLARFGHAIGPGTHLCCTVDGRPMTYNALKHWWADHRADYGLDGWTLHELRHTFATNLAQAGVHPSVMASLLGHASSEITMEIYTHVHNADNAAAMDSLSAARNVNVKEKGKIGGKICDGA